MAEQSRERLIAPQRRAVHLNKTAGQLSAGLLEFMNTAGEQGFARTRRPRQKHRFGRVHGHMLDLLDHLVESAVAGGNA